MNEKFLELISSLPEEERVVLSLFYLRELSPTEISAQLLVPERAVISVLKSGRQRLIFALNQEED
ncbi:MAG: sigma factor-like helix-turn-helix DNA-binding protein [Actinomycetota bacterium]|jgi:DNA-directed RNA polymerase specialized sigma24 family protein|nr:sigma factor-like helix-turn-helix DNA-binding protein [Actinomycetota bacterium]